MELRFLVFLKGKIRALSPIQPSVFNLFGNRSENRC